MGGLTGCIELLSRTDTKMLKADDSQADDPEEMKTLTGDAGAISAVGVKQEDDDDERITKKEVGAFRKIKSMLGLRLDEAQEERLLDIEENAAEDGDEDEEDEEDDFDYSAGGDVKSSLMWCCAGFLLSNAVAVTLYFTGTPQSDGDVAIQNFYAGYLLELTLSLDNLFAFYLIFKYFKVRHKEAVERTLFWGILGAMVLRAVVVASGVVA